MLGDPNSSVEAGGRPVLYQKLTWQTLKHCQLFFFLPYSPPLSSATPIKPVLWPPHFLLVRTKTERERERERERRRKRHKQKRIPKEGKRELVGYLEGGFLNWKSRSGKFLAKPNPGNSSCSQLRLPEPHFSYAVTI
jgi:hypothetical protein